MLVVGHRDSRFPCEVLWKTGAGSLPNVYLSGTLYHATSLGELIGGLPDLGVACTVDFFPKAAACQLRSFDFVPDVYVYLTQILLIQA